VAWVQPNTGTNLAALVASGAETVVLKQDANGIQLIQALANWLQAPDAVQASNLRCLHVEGGMSSEDLRATITQAFVNPADFASRVCARCPRLVELKLSCARFSTPVGMDDRDPSTAISQSFGLEWNLAVQHQPADMEYITVGKREVEGFLQGVVMAGVPLPPEVVDHLVRHLIEQACLDVFAPLF
jgi:hypothetical protein